MSHNIDKIFYINLDKRTDRRYEIEQELNNMELPYERFPAVYHKQGNVGCGYSHLSVLKLARDRGYKNVLIFEDDFTFLVSKPELESYLELIFNNIKNFDVCFLSYNCDSFQDIPGHSFVKRVLDSQTASGYIVNEKCYSKLIHLYEQTIPLLEQTDYHWIYATDITWKEFQKQDMWVCFDKRLGKQRASYSDNVGAFTDHGV
ncbi:MAG: glycosyltransferase family 25 protein [Alphaproteobacteria bacterium]|uniref:Glycosyl transferase family 25 domain-containing protein n=1 Tax=viral metagenome TaxID=1070528 RepID=A0A6C0HRP3_9ZZZZ|nr:glycosyltransferase family 25 protein [Alphaproteobacteria bacterium]